MLQLVYVSAARPNFSAEQFESIREAAGRRNQTHAVTGILLLRAGTFFQVLEGPEPGVNLIFERIKRDARHGHIRVLVRRYMHKREFADWSMAVIHPDQRLIPGNTVDDPALSLPLIAATPTAATRHMHLFSAGFHHPLDLFDSRPAVTPDRPPMEMPAGLYRYDKARLPFRR